MGKPRNRKKPSGEETPPLATFIVDKAKVLSRQVPEDASEDPKEAAGGRTRRRKTRGTSAGDADAR